MSMVSSTEYHSESAWRAAAAARGLQIGRSAKTGETVAYFTRDGKTYVHGRLRPVGVAAFGGPSGVQGWINEYSNE